MKRQSLFLIVLTLLVSIHGIASAITENDRQDQCAVPDPGIEVILNNESIVMQDQKGMATGPIVLNDTIYIPAMILSQITGMDISFDSAANQIIITPAKEIETVTENSGREAEKDNKNHAPNVTDKTDTDPAETPADGEEPISGYVWVLDRKEVDLYKETVNPDTYIYSYEGEKDGKEWFLEKCRWQYGEQYAHADEYSGCDVSPAAIKAGGDLSMEMTARIENFSYR